MQLPAFFLFLLFITLTSKNVVGIALQEEYSSLVLIEEFDDDVEESDVATTEEEETTTEVETTSEFTISTTLDSTISSTSDFTISTTLDSTISTITSSNEDGEEYVFSHSARKAGLASFFSILSLTIIGSVTYCFCKKKRQASNYQQSSIYQREPPQINLTLG